MQDIKDRVEKIIQLADFSDLPGLPDSLKKVHLAPHALEMPDIIKELTDQNTKLVGALKSLCPVSLKAAIRELEIMRNTNIEDNNLENAYMHIACELQRMEAAKAVLEELNIKD